MKSNKIFKTQFGSKINRINQDILKKNKTLINKSPKNQIFYEKPKYTNQFKKKMKKLTINGKNRKIFMRKNQHSKNTSRNSNPK